MMRSLFAGASGLRNHQVRMDVIGDNIANVNTLGFKASRVQFASLMAQSLAGATAPTENRGGLNPMQVGLGSAVGAVSSVFEQGSLQSTGIITDLAIEGDGLFVLGNGDRRLYTRAGSFRFDAAGLLTDPVTGYAVMGYNADLAGTVDTNVEIQEIRLPLGQATQARASTSMELGGNLNADSTALATLLDSLPLEDSTTSSAATTASLLTDLTNGDGTSLGLTNSDIITISGRVGDTEVTPFNYTVTLTSDLSDLASAVESALGLTAGSVTVDSDGSLSIAGAVGADNAISNLRVTATDTGGSTSRTVFATAMAMSTVQQARDAESYSMSKSVFDSLGFEHTVTYTFDRTQQDGIWNWSAAVDGDAAVVSGGSGTVRFGPEGALDAWTFDGGATSLVITPGNGARDLNIQIDPGDQGTLNGLTHFASTSTAVVRAQDGYGMGMLDSISIDQNGMVVGMFTNGVLRNLAQIGVAEFANPAGLQRAEGNTLVGSTNSGSPLVGTVGGRVTGRVQPGALEMSNVDLALEFTNMVIAQRGFQANARIITTADDMLAELVNLKR